MFPLHHAQIPDGVSFYAFRNARFKTNRITVHLAVPIQKETASVNALLPKLLRRCCKTHPDYLSLAKRLEELYGAYIEAGTQKRGDVQIITISLTGIDDRFAFDSAVNLPAASLLCDLLLNPVISENGELNVRYLNAEKKSLCDAIDATLNDKRGYAVSRAARALYLDDPAGIPAFGEKEDVQSALPQDIYMQYQTLLKTAQIYVMFTGCGDYEPLIPLLRDRFSVLNRTPYKADVHPFTKVGDVREVTEELDMLQAKLVLGYTGGGISSTDPRLPAMRVAVSILGGSPMSKLFMHVSEEKSLCYYCAARYDVAKGTMMIDCGVEHDDIERAKEAIFEQVEAMQKGDFTDQEILYAILSLKNAYQSVYETDITVESFFLGQLLSGLNSDPETQKALLDSVTREQIIEAANHLKLQLVYLLKGKETEE